MYNWPKYHIISMCPMYAYYVVYYIHMRTINHVRYSISLATPHF